MLIALRIKSKPIEKKWTDKILRLANHPRTKWLVATLVPLIVNHINNASRNKSERELREELRQTYKALGESRFATAVNTRALCELTSKIEVLTTQLSHTSSKTTRHVRG